jgi:hypothetical protein
MTPFPVNLIPEPLAEYIASAAKSMDCDAAYVAVPMLPVLASAIGNTRRVSLKGGWSEPAVVWAAVVGESGTVKSPALELATAPVWKRQRAILKEHAKQLAQYKSDLQAWKDTQKNERIEQRPEAPDRCQHPVCSDITVEAMADRLEATPRGVLVALDELGGWFGSFDRYKSGGGDVQQWLTMHGARSLKIDRKTGDRPTIFIPHAAVCLTGTIQPDTLRRALLPEYFECGLAARLLLAMPEPQAKRWSEHEIDPALTARVYSLFDALYAMRPDTDTGGEPCPRRVDLTDEARGAWGGFVNRWNRDMQDVHGPERAAAAKLEAYAARFALLLHCITQASGKKAAEYIEVSEIESGIALAEWFWAEIRRVYRAMSETSEDRQRRELLELVYRLGACVTPRMLKEHSRKFPTSADAEAALEELIADGMGAWETRLPTHGGRPATVFVLADSPDFPARSVPLSQNSLGNSEYMERNARRNGETRREYPVNRRHCT